MKMIREINDAEIKDGGAGAFYIYLKNYKINLINQYLLLSYLNLLIYSLLIIIFSPDLSVAVKLISSRIFL